MDDDNPRLAGTFTVEITGEQNTKGIGGHGERNASTETIIYLYAKVLWRAITEQRKQTINR